VSFVDPSLSTGAAGPTTRTRPDGSVETLYWRSCAGRVQYVWVGSFSAREVAQLAYQRVVRQLPAPQPQFAPPAESMLVNLESWFAVTPVAPIAATASVPGISSTVTAVPRRIILDTGSRVAGDRRIVECAPWGSTTAATQGCAWTPQWPSVPSATGTSDRRYHGSVTLVWTISWRGSNGTTGSLGELRTTTPVRLTVREVQTTAGG
jgi:hypothetical protein